MKKPYILLITSLLALGQLGAQSTVDYDYAKLLQHLEWELMAGNKRAIRDLATLLDREALRPRIQRLLDENCLFAPSELDLKEPLHQAEVLDFYYTHEDDIDYSLISGSFYLSPPGRQPGQYRVGQSQEQKTADVSTKLRQFGQDLEQAINTQQYQRLEPLIQEMAALKNREAYDFLKNWMRERGDAVAAPQRARVYQSLLAALQDHRELDCLITLLRLIDRGAFSAEMAAPYLTKLTNISVTEDGHYDQMTQRYYHYIDSLRSLDNLRQFGYEKLYSYQKSFFSLPVDYYGRLLSDERSYSWIRHNALADLVATGHPRALFYLAAQVYKARPRHHHLSPKDVSPYLDLIEVLTRIPVEYQNRTGDYEPRPGDLVAQRNFLRYWARHYTDYEWDAHQGLFTNKLEAAEITQNYERLFRRLPSRNDSVAIAAFRQLTEGEPGQIIELAQKYRQLLRNYNATLPSFQYQYLEQLTLLTDYCRRNNFSYQLSDRLAQQLYQLLHAKSPAERYRLENAIIIDLQLNEVTALEYWACLHEKNARLNFSIGRILDRFYSSHWADILADEQQLRLYLKKSYLFENIGAIGICNAYLRKFDIEDGMVQNRLTDLLKVESDNEIGNQIMQLIDEPEEEESLGLSDFLDNPMGFSRREIKILAAPSAVESERIVTMIQESEELDRVKILYYYLRLHPDLSEVPHLFRLIDDERVLSSRRGQVITVGTNTVPILEAIYKYHFPPPDDQQRYNRLAWKELWERDGAHYERWGEVFFQEKINSLADLEELDIEAINNITESSSFRPSHKAACLAALHKVRPVRNIKRLNIEPLLSPTTDLAYFQDIPFSYKDLDDLPKLFEVDRGHLMAEFMFEKSADFTVNDRGSFFNNLFRLPWFVSYLNDTTARPELIATVQRTLEQYLAESEFMSEFEEQMTNLNIAQIKTIGKPLAERLEASLAPELEEGSRIKIQQSILATVRYEDISTVLRLMDRFTVPQGARPFGFLHQDFGLPIFELEDPDDFIGRQADLSQYELYAHYLDAFGVDYRSAEGGLDFTKIYDILLFDIVTPFVGENGGKRDDYTYGIIKLLELHFETRLGFHEKLNEGQTFYTFSSAKRAAAWMAFLREKGLVQKREIAPTSYNLVSEGN